MRRSVKLLLFLRLVRSLVSLEALLRAPQGQDRPRPLRTPPPPGPERRPATGPMHRGQPRPGIPDEGGQPVHRYQPAVFRSQKAHARGDLRRPDRYRN